MPTPTDAQRVLFSGALDLLATKILEDEATIGVAFPYVTEESGAWRTMPASLSAGYSGGSWSHGNWFCGFWVGLLIAAHLHTGEDRFLALARERMRLVAPRCEDPNTHDIGFIFWSSAVPAHHVIGEGWFADLAVRAAARLRARLITTPGGAYLSSWGPLDDRRGRLSSAIDTMANLPLLYWAADHVDDGSFRLAGEAHARMTREAFIRADYSTFHAVEYDEEGRRARGFTFQGYADDSLWSRGQAWAIYGYAATAAATRNGTYLDLAEALGRRYLERLGDHPVPFWDFDDPAIPDAPRDSSAAAIVAAGFLTMARLHPDPEAGDMWLGHAHAMLECLCTDYLARDEWHRGLLRHGCYSIPHRDGVDSAVLFGDYFFVEALMAALSPGAFLPRPESLQRPEAAFR